jgi:hypothetical protein
VEIVEQQIKKSRHPLRGIAQILAVDQRAAHHRKTAHLHAPRVLAEQLLVEQLHHAQPDRAEGFGGDPGLWRIQQNRSDACFAQ